MTKILNDINIFQGMIGTRELTIMLYLKHIKILAFKQQTLV